MMYYKECAIIASLLQGPFRLLKSRASPQAHAAENLPDRPSEPTAIGRRDDDERTLIECPVCLLPLTSLQGDEERAAHVSNCLTTIGQSPAGFANTHGRYLVYTLKAGSPLQDSECVICFEEFQVGDKIARLECLCNYHRVRIGLRLYTKK